jgi:uncharacterized iron-regulated membrane protein
MLFYERRGMNRTEHTTPDVSDIRNPAVHHETTDVGLRGVAWFLFWLAVGVAIVALLMWGLFRFLDRRAEATEPPPLSRVGTGQERLPPEPRLQLAPGHEIHPVEDYQKFRAAEDERLNNYGWVNQAGGTVHIPLAEARRKFLEQQAQQTGQAPRTPEPLPLESSSGRKLERRNQ